MNNSGTCQQELVKYPFNKSCDITPKSHKLKYLGWILA
jgi:hypothetical protein